MSEKTLDVKKKNLKTALIYLGVAVFCVVFSTIYQSFSHGVHSPYMTYMFACPLVLGTLVFLIAMLAKLSWQGLGRAVYHSGVATLTVGCVMHGGLDIYGTDSRYIIIYFIAAPVLLLTGIVLGLIGAKSNTY